MNNREDILEDYEIKQELEAWHVRDRNQELQSQHREAATGQRAQASNRRVRSKHRPVTVEPICTCRSFRFPHELNAHCSLRSDHDWRVPNERHS